MHCLIGFLYSRPANYSSLKSRSIREGEFHLAWGDRFLLFYTGMLAIWNAGMVESENDWKIGIRE
jgi:hypothetical protein